MNQKVLNFCSNKLCLFGTLRVPNTTKPTKGFIGKSWNAMHPSWVRPTDVPDRVPLVLSSIPMGQCHDWTGNQRFPVNRMYINW